MDHTLLEKIRQHDKSALDEAYATAYPMVLKHVLDNNGNTADAEDVLQDAFLAAYIKVREPDFFLSSSFTTYLMGIAKNLWLKQLNRYKKRFKPDNTI